MDYLGYGLRLLFHRLVSLVRSAWHSETVALYRSDTGFDPQRKFRLHLFISQKIFDVTGWLRARLENPSQSMAADLDKLSVFFRQSLSQSSFQIFFLVLYYHLGLVFPAKAVQFLAFSLLAIFWLRIVASQNNWLVYLFHMAFYVSLLSFIYPLLPLVNVIFLIFCYNFLLRASAQQLVFGMLQLAIQSGHYVKLLRTFKRLRDQIDSSGHQTTLLLVFGLVLLVLFFY